MDHELRGLVISFGKLGIKPPNKETIEQLAHQYADKVNVDADGHRLCLFEVVRFWLMHVKQPSGCWHWIGKPNQDGYGKLNVGGAKNAKTLLAHRVAYILAKGPIPSDANVVCHVCDNPICVNPEHLFVGTQGDNVRDCMHKKRIANGDRHSSVTHPERVPKGERVWKATLTDHQVMKLRMENQTPVSIKKCKEIAAELGVGWEVIYNVLRGKTWRHLLVETTS